MKKRVRSTVDADLPMFQWLQIRQINMQCYNFNYKQVWSNLVWRRCYSTVHIFRFKIRST